MYGIRISLKTTITGDIQIEITENAFFLLRKIVLMSGLAICGVEGREGLEPVLEETVKVFLSVCWGGGWVGGGA